MKGITTITPYNSSGVLVPALSVMLDNSMVWIDEYQWNPMISGIHDTIQGGRTEPQEIPRNAKGRPITLETKGKQGYQKKSTVDALWSLRAPGTKYQLKIEHNGIEFTEVVIFRNWEEAGAIEFTMIEELSGLQMDDFWYVGGLRFEVSEL